MISQRVANGQRSTFHNRELRAWEIDCLVNIEVTGAITGGAFITYCQERHEPRTLAMLYRYAGTLPCKMMGLRVRVPAAAGSAGHEYINAHGFDVYRDGESRVVFSADGGRASHLLMLAVQAAAGSLQF
jgi:hypothetical protein